MAEVTGVVTGAGGDIGVAVCGALGRRGARVVCVDLTPEAAERGAAAVRAGGGQAEALAADVGDEARALAYAARCREAYGGASFFFNNAGIEGEEAPILEYPVAAWDRVQAVNLRGVFLGLKAMAPLLRDAGGGRIVNTASVAGLIATANLSAYGASKHAVIGLTKTAAVEFATLGIAVNALCPGPVESQMMRRIEAGVAPGAAEMAAAAYKATIPQKRYAELAEVANVAVYLLLDSPTYVTGQAIAVDGGLAVS